MTNGQGRQALSRSRRSGTPWKRSRTTSAIRSPAPRAERLQQVTAAPADAERQSSPSDYFRALPPSRRLAVACSSTLLVVASFFRFGVSAHALVGSILAAALIFLT